MMASKRPAVAYYRVSTKQQGRSGLGLEAQQAAVERFAEAEAYRLAEAYVEVESAKGDDMRRRPKLRAALAEAKRLKAPIIVSKLDRLSRDVHFVSGLMAHGVPFVTVELGSDVDPFVLHLFAALAEKERAMISKRTKEGLERARARGTNKRGEPLRLGGVTAGSLRFQQEARAFAETLRPIIEPLAEQGMSMTAIAQRLNATKVATAGGGRWHAATVKRVADRLAASDTTPQGTS
jgi:DNA invertase Pin-like site-specific DNA recombinase